MPTVNLGRRELAALHPTRGRAETYYDERLKGFGLRFHATGKASFILEYRPVGAGGNAPKKRITIGARDTMKLEEAKQAAKDMLAQIRLGRDPMAERQASRRAETAADLFDAYMKEHVRPKLKGKATKAKKAPAEARSSTVELYEGYLKNYVRPAWKNRKANSITRQDVQRLHRKIGSSKPDGLGKPGAANRLLTFVSGAFRWASEHGALPEEFSNPARGVKHFTEQKRERYLTAAEFARLGEALRLAETTGIPWTPAPGSKAKHAPKEKNRRVIFDPWAVAAIRLLIFSGARLREILHLKWSEVDLERGLLLLGDSKTGAKLIVLSAPALEILSALERLGPYVIASTDPDRPRRDLKRPWARITQHAGLDALHIHDLRHSFASVGVAGGLNLPVLGKLLGHADVATTQRYAHLSEDPVRRGADSIARTIEAQLAGKSGVVVPLRGSGE